MSKPVLYTFAISVWASAAQLVAADLPVDVDDTTINLLEGGNFNPEFVKLNPNATVPTLTHDGKSFTSTAEVINYLVSISQKKIAPETRITSVVHEAGIDPNFTLAAARNDEELTAVSKSFMMTFTSTRLGYLKQYAATPEGQAYKPFYDAQIAQISGFEALLGGRAPDEAKQGFFKRSTALWDAIKDFIIVTLPAAIDQGPFIGGAEPGVDDFHVAAWLARVASVVGAKKSDEGVSALENRFGPIPQKVKGFWQAWTERDSWAKVYPDNVLH